MTPTAQIRKATVQGVLTKFAQIYDTATYLGIPRLR